MFGLFLQAFKETNTKKALGIFFGSVGTVNCILLAGKNYFSLDIVGSLIFGFYFSLSLYISIFTFQIFKLYYKVIIFHYRDSIYGDAIILLKDALSEVHYLAKSDEIDPKRFKNTMALTCQQLKNYFDKKTNTDCAVSIKLIRNANTKVKPDAELYNLCRNKESTKRDTETYKSINHSIFNNTCFNTIFINITNGNKTQLHYININMPKTKNYQTTSLKAHAIESDKTKNEDWCLPYKSELVVPILPLRTEADNEYNLIGFLCADSCGINTFDEKYDLAILQGVADGIYNVIDRLNNSKNKRDEQY